MKKLLVALLLSLIVLPAHAVGPYAKKNFHEWLALQNEFSMEYLGANLAPEGTLPGTVIASPSRQDPDYFFHWVRDGALTMAVVLELAKRFPEMSRAINYCS